MTTEMTTKTETERKNRREEVQRILRSDNQTVTEWLRKQNDSVLQDLIAGEWTGWQGNKSFDRPITTTQKVRRLAKRVDANRSEAASTIRLVLARMYQHPNAATFSCWSVIPCLTDDGNLGVLNIASGTAWDSTVPAPEGTEDLGLVEEVYAAANGNAGTVRFDGEVVQTEGTAVEDGEILRPQMPPGWKQIALPTWRGYKGDGRDLVPEEVYKENPLRPKLVAYGLQTCYGRRGDPKRYLSFQPDYEGTCDWLCKKFERNDPSWWVLTPEEKEKCERLMNEWFDFAERNLDAQLTEEEKLITPHQFPNQKLPYWRKDWTAEESQEHSIASNRGNHAAKAVDKYLQQSNAYWLCGMMLRDGSYWNGGYAIGRRRCDVLRKRLAVIVDHRLIPVCESLRWMLSFPDPDRYYQMGPHQKAYDHALSAAASSICRSLMHECREVQAVINEMAEIHLADGPVFVSLGD